MSHYIGKKRRKKPWVHFQFSWTRTPDSICNSVSSERAGRRRIRNYMPSAYTVQVSASSLTAPSQVNLDERSMHWILIDVGGAEESVDKLNKTNYTTAMPIVVQRKHTTNQATTKNTTIRKRVRNKLLSLSGDLFSAQQIFTCGVAEQV